jgi:hypothetical protein
MALFKGRLMWPSAAPSHTAIDPYSQTEVLNRRFKRVAWSTSLLFLGVIALLILELIGVIPVSPLQPNIRVGGVRDSTVPASVGADRSPGSSSEPATP